MLGILNALESTRKDCEEKITMAMRLEAAKATEGTGISALEVRDKRRR
jgi:hypothetical protein